MPSDKSDRCSKKHRQHKHWKEEEDELLSALVIKYNRRKWKLVAAEMKTRNAKQCRERYYGHLEAGIDKTPLTKEEDKLILKMRGQTTNNGWAHIASVINKTFNAKRTPNQIKNNYNQRLSKLLYVEKLQTQTQTRESYEIPQEQSETPGIHDDPKGPFKALKYELTEITEQLTSQKLISLEISKSYYSYFRIPKDNQINIDNQTNIDSPIDKMSISSLLNPIHETY